MKIGHINRNKSRLNVIGMGNLRCKDNKVEDMAKMNNCGLDAKKVLGRKSVEMVWSYKQKNQNLKLIHKEKGRG